MRLSSLLATAFLAVLLAVPASAQQRQAPTLSPSAVDAAMAHVRVRAASLGLSPSDVAQLRVSDGHVSAESGITYVYLRQQFDGLDVTGTQLSLAVAPGGQVVHAAGSLAAALSESAQPAAGGSRAAAMGAEQALRAGAGHAGIALGSIASEATEGLSDARFRVDGLSSDATANAVYFHTADGALRRAWEVALDDPQSDHYWLLTVDAATGAELARYDLTVSETFGDDHGRHAAAEAVAASSGAPLASPADLFPSPVSSLVGTYRVFGMPVESPIHATTLPPADGRVTIANPDAAGGSASPFGWHDTNGAAGSETTTTNGNNVDAYTDTDANNLPDAGSNPSGGAGLSFVFPLDLTLAPSGYRPAAVANLFYWNNIIHDVMWQYGFTEPAGNFRFNNYGRGGAGNDPVNAEAQDGSGTNNANFSTPADGSRPRMQMFIGTNPNPDVDGDFDNAVIVHEYGHGISNRLVGGPANVGCLSNSEQMGEGWSDFFGLMLTMDGNDTATQARGIGNYLFGQPVNGPGIRPAPYSTSFATNDFTYQRTRTAVAPHGVGFIWATALWEVTWDLIAAHGYNANIYNATGSAGNQIALRLVTEGLKLTSCSPGFVSGRDAILQADANLYPDVANPGRGLHYVTLWNAFARRGLGFSASQGSTGSNADNTEAFDVPLPPPSASVSPSSVTASAAPGSSTTAIVTLSNTAPAGHGSLNFTARVIGGTLLTGPSAGARALQTASPVLAALAASPTPGTDGLRISESSRKPVEERVATEGTPTSSSFGAGGPDAFGYAWTDSNEPGGPVYAWVDIATTGTAVPLGDDAFATVALPFSFPFYGTGQASVNISSNGFLNFGAGSGAFTNTGIPNAAAPNNMIAAMWDDLDPGDANGTIYYRDMGDGRFVVQYEGVPDFPGPGPGTENTFQIILYADGGILMQYEDLNGDLLGSTVGLENADGTVGLQVALNQAYLADNLAIRFTQPTIWATVAPGSGSVVPGASTPLTLTLDATELTAGTYNATLRVESNDPAHATIDVPITFNVGSTTPPTYTVTEPAAGTILRAGQKVVIRWSGTGVPDSADDVDVFLRAPGGAMTMLAAAAPNTGKAKVILPAATPTDTGYTFVVRRSADAAVFGASGAFGIYAPADQYTFAEPDADETWLRGTTHTILWTRPASAPAGTVTLRLYRRGGGNPLITTYAAETDDGSFDFTTPGNFTTGSYFFTITNNTSGVYFGSSPRFTIARIEVTAPGEGATWATGSSQTVTWTTAQSNIPGATVKLSLRSVVGSTSLSLANNVPYSDGTRTVTVPATAAGQYYVQLLYKYTSPSNVVTQYVIASNTFTVSGPLTGPAPVARHFGSPEVSAEALETMVVVRGLAEGAEVGVFVTVGGDGGEHLLATGLVEAGEALVAVPSELVVGGGTGAGAEEWYFGETTALTLRVFDAGRESAVEVRAVTLGSDGSALEAVRLAAGDVVVVDAAKGGAVGEASAAAFAVQGMSPNPATTSATVRFTSPTSTAATVVVYDLLGRAVQTAFSGEAQAGLNEVSVSTAALPAGVYVVRVTAGAESAATRFTVVR